MNNRTLGHFLNLAREIVDKIANVLIPKGKRVNFLENLGPDGLFENIPQAENFDIPTQANFDTTKIKAIFNYRTALCRQAIWEIKYRANRKLIQDFSLLLYEYILEELADLETFSNFKNIVLIPIPSSPARTREKGFNQCILICQELIKIDQERKQNNFTLLENFLIKEKDTVHQARANSRKARLENLINTFTVNRRPDFGKLSERLGTPSSEESCSEIGPAKILKHSFIIIDDVITTGATMKEAFRALKEAGINTRKIRGFALAH